MSQRIQRPPSYVSFERNTGNIFETGMAPVSSSTPWYKVPFKWLGSLGVVSLTLICISVVLIIALVILTVLYVNETNATAAIANSLVLSPTANPSPKPSVPVSYYGNMDGLAALKAKLVNPQDVGMLFLGDTALYSTNSKGNANEHSISKMFGLLAADLYNVPVSNDGIIGLGIKNSSLGRWIYNSTWIPDELGIGGYRLRATDGVSPLKYEAGVNAVGYRIYVTSRDTPLQVSVTWRSSNIYTSPVSTLTPSSYIEPGQTVGYRDLFGGADGIGDLSRNSWPSILNVTGTSNSANTSVYAVCGITRGNPQILCYNGMYDMPASQWAAVMTGAGSLMPNFSAMKTPFNVGCVFMCVGQAELQSSGSITVADYVSSVTTSIQTVKNQGVTPYLITSPPQFNGTGQQAYITGIINYCKANSIPYYDLFAACGGSYSAGVTNGWLTTGGLTTLGLTQLALALVKSIYG